MGATVNWLLLCAGTAVIMLAGWWYFRRVRVDRPPVGVFNLRDVAFTFGMLIVIPPLYLDLPTWLVGSILALTATGLLFLTMRPMFGGRIAFAIAGGLAVGEVVLTTRGYGQSTTFVVLNDIAIAILVVGVCNIWAQSGFRARDVAIFACAVSIFDLVAVWLMPLMLEFFTQVRALPFAPMLAVGPVTLGMGDLLFIVLWPLVALKAFGTRPSLFAATGTLTCLVALAIAFRTNMFTAAVPAMVFVAPIIVAQYFLFRRHHPERTTGEYQGIIPADSQPTLPDLTAALELAESGHPRRPARFLAIHPDGTILGTAATPGAATRAARAAAPDTTPVLVLNSPAATRK